MNTTILFSALAILLSIQSTFAQEAGDKKKDSKYEVIEIQTSAVCGDCKERLEHDMAFEKGVKFVELDSETKILTIKFKKGKTTKEDLKKAVTKIGYDADDLVAEQKAHDALPKCCQKGTAPH